MTSEWCRWWPIVMVLVNVQSGSGLAPPTCDVLIAGGSTAALAAAITAAEADSSLHVCLTEPTDGDCGGQMTSSGVSAVDFGTFNREPANQPQSFRDLINYLNSQGKPGCWVSETCYNPRVMVSGWVKERLARSSNLVVLSRTVVKSATVNGNGAITALELIQRTPKSDVDEWDLLLSETLSDWYSPQDSARFTKEVITVAAPVVIDATEFGDVLMTAKLTVGQGVERPSELSPPGSDDQCGQAATLTFFMELLDTPPTTPDPAPPGGTAGGANFSAVGCCCPTTVSNSGQCDYRGIWSYRRAVSRKSAPSWSEINAGDVSQQNWGNPSGNDLDNGYMFVSLDDARASVEAGTWAGGVNLTALSMLEQRAYGWFHAYAAAFPTEYWNRFVLNRSITGTSTGLSKLPYLRDTRRAVGLNGYRLTHYNESAPSDGSKYGMRPLDAVAFGNYGADDHNIVTCSKPEYMSSASTVPYYIPFRALTHGEAPNLLVAGKTMAMTFYANSAARLHPAEWSSGVAAGAAAVIMTRHSSTTSELYTHWVPELQKLLTAVGAPLYWS